MKTHYHKALLCTTLLLLTACSGNKNEEVNDEGVATVLPTTDNEVTVEVLKQRAFNHELVSNGKIVAGGQADLRFETSGVIARIYVKMVRRCSKGKNWLNWINSACLIVLPKPRCA